MQLHQLHLNLVHKFQLDNLLARLNQVDNIYRQGKQLRLELKRLDLDSSNHRYTAHLLKTFYSLNRKILRCKTWGQCYRLHSTSLEHTLRQAS